jgi:hypothetical protein
MRFFLFFLFFVVGSKVHSQPVKRALVVTIGNYPYEPDKNQTWQQLASDNDKVIVLKQLNLQGYESQNIISLSEEQATIKNIRTALNNFCERSNAGDIFYFHFSGHGQQVTDLTNTETLNERLYLDEVDGLDEALVTYEAPFKVYDGYRLQDHLIDDEIHFYFSKLKDKLGSNGQIIAVFDACHSGTLSRGGGERIRGTGRPLLVERKNEKKCDCRNIKNDNLGFDVDFSFPSQQKSANLIVFSGCKSYEKNHEFYDTKTKNWYGSLTFALINTWSILNINSTYKDWYSKINEFISLNFNNNQHPELEGDFLDVSVMNGNLVETDIFYQINLLKENVIELNAGTLNSLNIGDSISLCAIDTKKISDDFRPIASGTISEVTIDKSILIVSSWFGNNINNFSELNVKAFVSKRFQPNEKMKIKLTVQSKKVRNQIISTLLNNSNISIKENGAKIILKDTLLNPQKKITGIIARYSYSGLLVQNLPFKTIWNLKSFDTLWMHLENALRIDVFRKITSVSEETNFEIKLFKISQNDTINIDLNYAKFVIGDYIYITITNIGRMEARYYLLDIMPNNQIQKVDPINEISNQIIPPKKSIKITLGPVDQPFGLEQLKIISSSKPIDFSSVLNLGQTLTQTRGVEMNHFVDFISSSAKEITKRGENQESSELSNVSIKNLYFEISPLNPNL